MNAPKDFEQELELPSEIRVQRRSDKPLDLVVLFAKAEATLKKDFSRLAAKLSAKGMHRQPRLDSPRCIFPQTTCGNPVEIFGNHPESSQQH